MDTRYGPRWLVAGACTVFVLAGGLIAWNRDSRHASARNPGMTCPMIVRGDSHLPLTPFGVHRVALIGDSIMFQPSCVIAESLSTVGITTSRHAVAGSGL